MDVHRARSRTCGAASLIGTGGLGIMHLWPLRATLSAYTGSCGGQRRTVEASFPHRPSPPVVDRGGHGALQWQVNAAWGYLGSSDGQGSSAGALSAVRSWLSECGAELHGAQGPQCVVRELRCPRSVRGLFADEMACVGVESGLPRLWTLSRFLFEDGVGLDRTTWIIRVAGSRLK